MKKIISLIITAALLLTSTTIAFACDDSQKNSNSKYQHQEQNKNKHPEPAYKFDANKIPFSKIIVDLGATVAFDKATTVLTVTKGTNTVVINYKSQTVTLNGAAVTDSGILTAKNNEKMTECLLKYLEKALKGDNNTNTGLNAPTKVTVTPVGGTVVANTLNSTTHYMTVTAIITAGQATGGKAELYVGSKLIATDAAILAGDKSITFTTSDGTPTNEELQELIPAGGVVTVKLYNSGNTSITSAVNNPTLVVDYEAPTITDVTSAIYNPTANQLYITVTGAGIVGDKVDVTKISLIDSHLGKAYQLTNTAGTGSVGVVSSANLLSISIGSADKIGLTGFGETTMSLMVAAGHLLTDAAGNSSDNLSTITVPATIQ